MRLALVGDYNPEVVAHQAIPLALKLAGDDLRCKFEVDWVPTEQLAAEAADRLAGYQGVWVVPASPYRSMEGALAAIEYARTRNLPFLGTCGGYQHTLIEYARNVLGIQDADHAETNPDASVLFITPLACSLRGVDGPIHLKPHSRIAEIYGTTDTIEQYNCSFGLNPEYRHLFEHGGLTITAEDDSGSGRVVELDGHPFFIATLYQPERSALRGAGHPLIRAFLTAASAA